MQTYEEQIAFFEEHWPELRTAVETDGASGAIAFMTGFDDELERRVLYVFARQGFVMQDWEGKAFEPYIEVCDAGLAEIVGQAEAAADDETRAMRLSTAHVVSFNLAADLADCWPGDDDPRLPAHFERGVRAADDCLRWCDEDNLHALAADHWVKGTHLLSLGEAAPAAESFARALEIAIRLAEQKGKAGTITPEGDFGAILYSGYLGIAEEKAGRASGGSRYDRALAAFRGQLKDPDAKEDAEFGMAQIEKVRGAHGV